MQEPAKISGIAVELEDAEPAGGSHRFRIDVTEIVVTAVGSPADHLVIEMWDADRGLVRLERR